MFLLQRLITVEFVCFEMFFINDFGPPFLKKLKCLEVSIISTGSSMCVRNVREKIIFFFALQLFLPKMFFFPFF